MPNATHAVIQSNLIYELRSRYRLQYRVLSELTLDTPPRGSTPDVVIYPYFDIDFTLEYPARRSEPPFVTIEITGPPSRSPSQSLDEMVDKAVIYFEFGVKSCWIIQPRIKAIFVFDRPNHYLFFHYDDILKDPVSTIELPLSTVFE